MDIKQDPNSIPNFGGGGRLGEPARDEPEQAQSSVELDRGAAGEGDATAVDVSTPDPTQRGPGAVDGLVGAP